MPCGIFVSYLFNCLYSDGSRNLTGAKAAGASIDSLWSTVYNGLNSFNIGFPGSV